MNETYGRIDAWWRGHPRLMLWTTILLALATFLIVISKTKDTATAYRAF